ncbi:MAG: hypothetical protein GX767_02080 [Firmicutes bacterium]|nr:hypothetical protein [Bacillota bacterium]
MLKDEVLDAVAKGQFHIYAVSNVFEGLEILTGLPAGERQKDGTFPEGTINYLVSRKIKKYNDILKKEKEADKALEVKNRSEE